MESFRTAESHTHATHRVVEAGGLALESAANRKLDILIREGDFVGARRAINNQLAKLDHNKIDFIEGFQALEKSLTLPWEELDWREKHGLPALPELQREVSQTYAKTGFAMNYVFYELYEEHQRANGNDSGYGSELIGALSELSVLAIAARGKTGTKRDGYRLAVPSVDQNTGGWTSRNGGLRIGFDLAVLPFSSAPIKIQVKTSANHLAYASDITVVSLRELAALKKQPIATVYTAIIDDTEGNANPESTALIQTMTDNFYKILDRRLGKASPSHSKV